MNAPCPVTLGGPDTGLGALHRCRLPKDHDGRHESAGAYWWHGNGEDCHICNGDRHE